MHRRIFVRPIDGKTHVNLSKYLQLVALNKEEGEIKFISGNFFKSKIADDFDIDVSNIDSIVSYLRWRLYHTKPDSIIYDGKKNVIANDFISNFI